MGSGVFLQTDPIPGGSANAYDYAGQDPINRWDPAGTEEMEMGEGGGEAELAAEMLDDPGVEFGDYLAEHPEEAVPGDFGDLYTSNRSLQHMFDQHKGDWGLRGNWNKSAGAALKDELERFYSDSDTQMRYGWYRGKPAAFAYNTGTNQCIVTSRMGDLIGGWRLSDQQLNYVLTTGRLN